MNHFHTSDKSLATYVGAYRGGRCGYCGYSESTKFNYGMLTDRLTVQDYQDLIDRGWRRCGTYSYKFRMNTTCCPAYTIRCDAPNFTLSRSQKRILRQVSSYINSDIKPRPNTKASQPRNSSERPVKISSSNQDFSITPKGDASSSVSCCTDSPVVVKETGDTNMADEQTSCVPEQSNQSNSAAVNDEIHTPPDRLMHKAKSKRWLRKINRMKQRAENENIKFSDLLESYQARRNKRLEKTRQKSLEDYFNMAQPPEQAKHKLEIRLVQSSPPSEEFIRTKSIELNVYQKYQIHVHGDSLSSVGERQFTRFLVDSPLMKNDRCGSFHQQYWLDDKLIAVGVIDILPSCVSSVYLFYDPDYEFLSLGTYTALREIGFVRELHMNYSPTLRYYYMGFYIHSCRKMRYKGQYHPSYLACPETYSWQPIKNCVPLLDQSEYSRLDPDPSAKDPDAIDENDDRVVSEVLITFDGNEAIHLGEFFEKYKRFDTSFIREWANLVGKKCARRIAFKIR